MFLVLAGVDRDRADAALAGASGRARDGRGQGQGRLEAAARAPGHGAAVCAGLRAVLRLLRAVRVGARAYGIEAAGISTSTLGIGAGRQHRGDRGRAVRRTAVRRAAPAVAGDRRGRADLGRRVGNRRVTRGWGTAARRWRPPRSSRRTRCSGSVRPCCRRPSRRWWPILRRRGWSGSTTPRSRWSSSLRWRSGRRWAGRWGPRCTAPYIVTFRALLAGDHGAGAAARAGSSRPVQDQPSLARVVGGWRCPGAVAAEARAASPSARRPLGARPDSRAVPGP